MTNGENPRRPECGQPLDIILNPVDGSSEVGPRHKPGLPQQHRPRLGQNPWGLCPQTPARF